MLPHNPRAFWSLQYIKKHKLQDAKKKTLINADDALKAVFGGKKQVTMFEMTKQVSGHTLAKIVGSKPLPRNYQESFPTESAEDTPKQLHPPINFR